MFKRDTYIRVAGDIAVVDGAGYSCRRYLGGVSAGEASVAPIRFGALEVLDDVLIEAGSHFSVEIQDGFDALVYVVEGRCRIEVDGAPPRDIGEDTACGLLGHAVTHDLHNGSSTASLRVVVLAFAGASAAPREALAVAALPRDRHGIAWFAGPDATASTGDGVLLGLPARVAIARLEPGVERVLHRTPDHGAYVVVLEGYIELGAGFVDKGGDAMALLRTDVRLQGVRSSKVMIVVVPVGFAATVA